MRYIEIYFIGKDIDRKKEELKKEMKKLGLKLFKEAERSLFFTAPNLNKMQKIFDTVVLKHKQKLRVFKDKIKKVDEDLGELII